MSLVLSFICILLLATFPSWHQEHDPATGSEIDVKPFPSRPVLQVALACSFVAAMLFLIASIWQHVGAVGAAAIADITGYGNIRTAIGTNAMIMVWASFIVCTVVAIGLTQLLLSIQLLDRLTDD
jgi:hypothetical protein